MALLDIANMGNPILRRTARSVEAPANDTLRVLAADMIETMLAYDGVGIAAPQVHQGIRLIAFHLPPDRLDGADPGPAGHGVTVLLNPSFEPCGHDRVIGLEGCLSIPGLRGLVPRYHTIRYRGLTPAGEPVEREASGFHARVVQHEIDHLDGVLFIDRMDDLRTLCFESELQNMIDGDGDG